MDCLPPLSPQTPETPETPETPAGADPRAARQLGFLEEMSTMGMDFVRSVHAKAFGPEAGPNPDVVELGMTFTRITHGVRQSITLESRIAAGPLPRGPRRGDDDADAPHPNAPKREEIRRIASAAIRREGDPSDIEFMLGDLNHWLDSGLVDHELVKRPIAAIAGGLCRNLGISRDIDDFLAAQAAAGPAHLHVFTPPPPSAAPSGQDPPPAMDPRPP